MDWTTIITSLLTFVAGGGIFTLVTIGVQRKKLKAGVKSDEIDNMRKALEDFYKPLLKTQDERIASQNDRINELEAKVRQLEQEKQEQAMAYQKQIAELQKQITDITRALGIKANKQIRASKGQFTPKKEDA